MWTFVNERQVALGTSNLDLSDEVGFGRATGYRGRAGCTYLDSACCPGPANPYVSSIFCHFFSGFSFMVRKFSRFFISSGKFLDFPDFEPEFFPRFNFRTEKQIQKIQFTGASVLAFSDGGKFRYENGDPFFQLSTGIFFSFSNFNPEIFPPDNFRTKKRSVDPDF